MDRVSDLLENVSAKILSPFLNSPYQPFEKINFSLR
jgi:hypothetical protein